jgi:hypothetical protein
VVVVRIALAIVLIVTPTVLGECGADAAAVLARLHATG